MHALKETSEPQLCISWLSWYPLASASRDVSGRQSRTDQVVKGPFLNQRLWQLVFPFLTSLYTHFLPRLSFFIYCVQSLVSVLFRTQGKSFPRNSWFHSRQPSGLSDILYLSIDPGYSLFHLLKKKKNAPLTSWLWQEATGSLLSFFVPSVLT